MVVLEYDAKSLPHINYEEFSRDLILDEIIDVVYERYILKYFDPKLLDFVPLPEPVLIEEDRPIVEEPKEVLIIDDKRFVQVKDNIFESEDGERRTIEKEDILKFRETVQRHIYRRYITLTTRSAVLLSDLGIDKKYEILEKVENPEEEISMFLFLENYVYQLETEEGEAIDIKIKKEKIDRVIESLKGDVFYALEAIELSTIPKEQKKELLKKITEDMLMEYEEREIENIKYYKLTIEDKEIYIAEEDAKITEGTKRQYCEVAIKRVEKLLPGLYDISEDGYILVDGKKTKIKFFKETKDYFVVVVALKRIAKDKYEPFYLEIPKLYNLPNTQSTAIRLYGVEYLLRHVAFKRETSISYRSIEDLYMREIIKAFREIKAVIEWAKYYVKTDYVTPDLKFIKKLPYGLIEEKPKKRGVIGENPILHKLSLALRYSHWLVEPNEVFKRKFSRLFCAVKFAQKRRPFPFTYIDYKCSEKTRPTYREAGELERQGVMLFKFYGTDEENGDDIFCFSFVGERGDIGDNRLLKEGVFLKFDYEQQKTIKDITNKGEFSRAFLNIPLPEYMPEKRINIATKLIINQNIVVDSEDPIVKGKYNDCSGVNAKARFLEEDDDESIKLACWDGGVVISDALAKKLRYVFRSYIGLNREYIDIPMSSDKEIKGKKKLKTSEFFVRKGENIVSKAIRDDLPTFKTKTTGTLSFETVVTPLGRLYEKTIFDSRWIHPTRKLLYEYKTAEVGTKIWSRTGLKHTVSLVLPKDDERLKGADLIIGRNKANKSALLQEMMESVKIIKEKNLKSYDPNWKIENGKYRGYIFIGINPTFPWKHTVLAETSSVSDNFIDTAINLGADILLNEILHTEDKRDLKTINEFLALLWKWIDYETNKIRNIKLEDAFSYDEFLKELEKFVDEKTEDIARRSVAFDYKVHKASTKKKFVDAVKRAKAKYKKSIEASFKKGDLSKLVPLFKGVKTVEDLRHAIKKVEEFEPKDILIQGEIAEGEVVEINAKNMILESLDNLVVLLDKDISSPIDIEQKIEFTRIPRIRKKIRSERVHGLYIENPIIVDIKAYRKAEAFKKHLPVYLGLVALQTDGKNKILHDTLLTTRGTSSVLQLEPVFISPEAVISPESVVILPKKIMNEMKIKENDYVLVTREPIVTKSSMGIFIAKSSVVDEKTKTVIKTQTDNIILMDPTNFIRFHADADGDILAIWKISEKTAEQIIDMMPEIPKLTDEEKLFSERTLTIDTRERIVEEEELEPNPEREKEWEKYSVFVEKMKKYRHDELHKQVYSVYFIGGKRKELALFVQRFVPILGTDIMEIVSLANVELGMAKPEIALKTAEEAEAYLRAINNLLYFIKDKYLEYMIFDTKEEAEEHVKKFKELLTERGKEFFEREISPIKVTKVRMREEYRVSYKGLYPTDFKEFAEGERGRKIFRYFEPYRVDCIKIRDLYRKQIQDIENRIAEAYEKKDVVLIDILKEKLDYIKICPVERIYIGPEKLTLQALIKYYNEEPKFCDSIYGKIVRRETIEL